MCAGQKGGVRPSEEFLAEVRKTAGYLWERGWAEANAGNLSVDLTEGFTACDSARSAGAVRLDESYPGLAGRIFFVTGTGRRFRDAAEKPAENTCLLRMDAKGAGYDIIWGGEAEGFRPTSELRSHLRLQEMLRRRNAPAVVVLHAHPTELIVLSHLPEYRAEADFNKAIWGIHPETKIAFPRGVGLVPYVLPGSEMLARNTTETFERGVSVALWETHGCVALGENLGRAFDLIDTLNKAAKMILMCRSLGFMPPAPIPERLRELTTAFNLED